MKKNIMMFLFLIAGSVLFVACSGATELSFTNSSNSDGAINEIVWANGDANWTKDGGYDLNATTESKEVNETKGSVTCTYYSGTEFAAADVLFDNGTSALTLTEGSANNYTLTASDPAAASRKNIK